MIKIRNYLQPTNMKNTFKVILTIMLLLSVNLVFAQGTPPATPIDGGLSLLLVGGAAYGIIKDKR